MKEEDFHLFKRNNFSGCSLRICRNFGSFEDQSEIQNLRRGGDAGFE